jgi:hypothetical protein
MKKISLIFLYTVVTSLALWAEIKLPAVFSDNMVLQRDQEINIWGWGDKNEKIKVAFNGQVLTTKTDKAGNWKVTLRPIPFGGPYTLEIQGKNSRITKENILVGDVWLCSGQSNMVWTVANSMNANSEIKAADYSQIRSFNVVHEMAVAPKNDFNGKWEICSPATAGDFSAVAYYFARKLYMETGIPIGIINSSWGGTDIETWISPDVFSSLNDSFKVKYKRNEKPDDFFVQNEKNRWLYETALENDLGLKEEWQNPSTDISGWGDLPVPQIWESPDLADMDGVVWMQYDLVLPEFAGGKPAILRLGKIDDNDDTWINGIKVDPNVAPSLLYNAMIHPIIRFALKGVIWYQGENNANQAYAYQTLFPSLITDWRTQWGQEFPFYWVQLANYMRPDDEPKESAWAELREAQTKALSLPKTGQAVTIDIGDAADIHPRNKQDVGLRLALIALNKEYGRKNKVYSGPVYKSMEVIGNKIAVTYDYIASGLKVSDKYGYITGFTIAGADKKFVWAKAYLEGNKVIVYSDKVQQPVAVRYNWANNTNGNLYNREGLPACPFRTDSLSPSNPIWNISFDDIQSLPDSWIVKGKAGIDQATGFKGHSLVLEKTEDTLLEPVSVETPDFAVSPGNWNVSFAAKSDLRSMDNSYKGSLFLKLFDKNKKQMEDAALGALYGYRNWKQEERQIEIPQNVAFVRFFITIEKETPGKFWLDELSISPVKEDGNADNIKRMMFTTAQMGNLLYPDDSDEINIDVWTAKPLSEKERKLTIVLKDYWGAEQAEPIESRLELQEQKEKQCSYAAKINLGSLPLEVGRYYELHGVIRKDDGTVFTNYTSFAILPEAEANSYKPEEIPWTIRSWDNRYKAHVYLAHRLGIRICGIWGVMDADTTKQSAPCLDLIEELGMGFLTVANTHAIEKRSGNWRELMANDGELLRRGVRNFIAKYGHVRPMIVNLGNEPHNKGEDVKENVEAYRMVYEEIKKIDPSIFVLGTSIGPNEDFAKYGFGKWCDAYDFHVYEDALSVRNMVEVRYPELFKKYGQEKPVWSTELGLNSQGMARHAVAAELYRKTANFFAGGGANMCWFGLLYPDPDAKLHDSFGSAHNVFDCRYSKYAPKLDAIAYYNAVNSLGVKKPVEDKIYNEGVQAFLFRDNKENALQILYRENGRSDVFIPLKDVDEVKVIKIDGSIKRMNAGKKGITLSITDEPVLIEYKGGAKSLPAALEDPGIYLNNLKESVVAGEKSEFDVVLNDVPEHRVELQLPPFWTTNRNPATDAEGRKMIRYTFQIPVQSAVREADIAILIKDENNNIKGELSYRSPVTSALSLEILPMPLIEEEKPSVKLVIKNNSSVKQALTWNVELYGEQRLVEGLFTEIENTSAYFEKTPSGKLELAANSTKEIILPLADVDLYKVYKMKASVRDALGRTVEQDRPVSAFYGAPKVKKALTMDGKLDEEAWKSAPVRRVDKRDQVWIFVTKDQPVNEWTGADDLSADIRFLWDNDYLYVSLDVADDTAGKILHSDADLWKQDGLQFLIDPMRTSKHKIGKYDYSLGEGAKGLQAWCTLTAAGSAPTGNVPEIEIGLKREENGSGNVVYEIAIPWHRLAPFKPEAGGDLGFTLIVNEDDGNGRDSYIMWFGNASTKNIDTVGDLILME